MEGAVDDNINLRVSSFACHLDSAKKDNMVHKVSAQEIPIALNSSKTQNPSIKKPSNPNFSPSSKDHTKDSLTNLRVDSFSYLNNTKVEKFMFDIPGPIKHPTSSFTFSQLETTKNGEISIFGADKYFNMKLEYHMGATKNERPVVLARSGSDTGPRTPSLCSEARSSNNSQTALLQRNGSTQRKHKHAIGRRFFSRFGCQGNCLDTKDVHTNELLAKPSRSQSQRIDHAKPETQEVDQNLEESRDSIEVFGSKNTSNGDHVASNMERKLSMLTWDAIPNTLDQNDIPTSTVEASTICDDMASEASSDLFEIDNISKSMYPTVAPTAAAAKDDASICNSPVSNYAPSEASIQWSVVTASAADYNSVSDYNDEMNVRVSGDRMMLKNDNGTRRNSKTGYGGGKEGQKSRPGGLLGCKSHKSVDVAENVRLKTA